MTFVLISRPTIAVNFFALGIRSRTASQIVVLEPGEFIYGFRENRQVPPKEFVPVREFMLFLENGNWTKSDFFPLLKHNDAKVRNSREDLHSTITVTYTSNRPRLRTCFEASRRTGNMPA